jgi:leucyl aminopeptidase
MSVQAVPHAQEALGESEVVVIAMAPAAEPGDPVEVAESDLALVAGWGVDLRRRLARARATGARGEIVWVDLEQERPAAVVVLGLGSGTPAHLRRAGALLSRRLRGCGDVLVTASRDWRAEGIRAFVEGLYLPTGGVTWAGSPPPAPPARVRVLVGGHGAPADPETAADPVGDGREHALATIAARRLIHTPPNIKSPAWMADRAGTVAARRGLAIRVWEPEDLAREGFGGIVAVGAGSTRSPRLVQLTWDPGRPAGRPRHVVLVGKGITFDSGGLSLKPRDSMIGMKTDMSGAAVVLAVLEALAGGRPVPDGLRVTGLLCLAENLPGATATRPGDVITHHGGLTSEVVNTDAEGRLVLGDGLHLAVDELGADAVVDIATLTGAATLGLGRQHAAMFSTSDRLADELSAAGSASGEQVWRMPLHADYAALIESDVADQANAARGPVPLPGAITAALFLQRFVGDTPWAHLDIAGPGRSEADRDEVPRGGTGFGARLLLRWLEAGAPF